MISRASGPRLAILCDRLHRLSRVIDPVPGPQRGHRFERRVESELLNLGFPVRAVAGGVEVLGTLPASGMRHQIDAEAWCGDCDVIGEWKSYRAPVPNNELMLFKAKSDDIFESLVRSRPRHRPLVRVFGIAGDATAVGRRYAARHGIVLIERSVWPAPVLGDPMLQWPGPGPTADELRALAFLARPLQRVYRRTTDGRLVAPRVIPEDVTEQMLAIQRRVSRRFEGILRHARDAA